MAMTKTERDVYQLASNRLLRAATTNGHDHPHRFEAGDEAVPKGCLPRCRVCRTTVKAPWHTNEHKKRPAANGGNGTAPRTVAEQTAAIEKRRARVTERAAVTDGTTIAVSCPTCHGTGTLALAVADVQRLALRVRS